MAEEQYRGVAGVDVHHEPGLNIENAVDQCEVQVGGRHWETLLKCRRYSRRI